MWSLVLVSKLVTTTYVIKGMPMHYEKYVLLAMHMVCYEFVTFLIVCTDVITSKLCRQSVHSLKQVGTTTLPTAIPLKSSSSMRATLVFNLFFK
jgi:hypothetical protein